MLSHEIQHLVRISQRERATLAEPLHQRGLPHDVAAEAGFGHTGRDQEGLDPGKQLFVIDQVHTRAGISSLSDTQGHVSSFRESDAAEHLCHKDDMTDDAPTLYNLLMSIKPDGLSENAWASRAQVSRNFFQAVKKGARPRVDNLEKVIVAIGLTPAQFYNLEGARDVAPADASAPKAGLPFQRRDEPNDVPLVGTAQGSDFEVDEEGKITFVERMDLDLENVVDHVVRPASLAGRLEIYAITVIGDSMKDRYEDGDPAYVDPRRQPRPGDYVIVQLIKRDGDGEGRVATALLKQLVKKTSQYVELEQKNPPVTFTIPMRDVAHIHRVIPWREIIF